MKALIIPADPSEPCRVVNLAAGARQLANLQDAVGGYVDVQAHDECDIWVNDEGRLIDLPVNVRVSHWMLNESERAKRGEVGESMVMYGDAVLTGPADSEGDVTPVDDELVKHFQDMKLDQSAMRDWDTREVSFRVMDWPEDPPSYGEGGGLSM